MSPMTYVGLAIAVLLIAGLAIYSGTKVKKGNAAGNSAAIVTGVIMGTLVGGSSTVGTAQLAYNYGMSAWWWTLGAGIGCLILAFGYAKQMRAEDKPTLVGMIANEYGKGAGLAASILNSVGTFINIISQLLAASAVILVVLPNLGTLPTVICSAVIMVLYVIFGGTKGAGMVGILKTVLLYSSMIACGLLALRLIGGASAVGPLMARFSAETGRNFASLFARGVGKDLGACLSLILGVLTTQTYAQAVLTAKSDGAARAGSVVSAILIPPLGIFGILVGLYMRTVTDPSTFVAKTALTEFALKHAGLPGIIAGIVLGALFIASVGTGAGLALGISNVVNRDIVKRFTHKFDDEKKSDRLAKILIVVILAAACCLSTGKLGDTILNFAFMSMGLRGATVFAPLCFLLWAKGKVDGKWALASIIVGPVVVLLFGTVGPLKALLNGVDALFPGIIAALAIMIIGFAAGRKKQSTL